jgi:hypothetical protein
VQPGRDLRSDLARCALVGFDAERRRLAVGGRPGRIELGEASNGIVREQWAGVPITDAGREGLEPGSQKHDRDAA